MCVRWTDVHTMCAMQFTPETCRLFSHHEILNHMFTPEHALRKVSLCRPLQVLQITAEDMTKTRTEELPFFLRHRISWKKTSHSVVDFKTNGKYFTILFFELNCIHFVSIKDLLFHQHTRLIEQELVEPENYSSPIPVATGLPYKFSQVFYRRTTYTNP